MEEAKKALAKLNRSQNSEAYKQTAKEILSQFMEGKLSVMNAVTMYQESKNFIEDIEKKYNYSFLSDSDEVKVDRAFAQRDIVNFLID